jgi:hypothetical protein
MTLNPNDVINGLFELMGAACLVVNVRQALRDKQIKGVHWGPTIYFTAWGIWNLWYYPSLNQWFSLAGGLAITLMNLVWLALVIRYWRRA